EAAPTMRGLDERVREMYHGRPRTIELLSLDDRRVIAHGDDVRAEAEHQQLIEERPRPDRTRGVPGEASRNNLPPLHLAARAELGPQPHEGMREIGVCRAANVVDGERRPIARGDVRIARREIRGAQATIHAGRVPTTGAAHWRL